MFCNIYNHNKSHMDHPLVGHTMHMSLAWQWKIAFIF